MRKYKILYTKVLAGVFAAAFIALGIQGCSKKQSNRDDFEVITVIPERGQTAWDVAELYCPDDVDIRLYLSWCAELNGACELGHITYGRSYLFLRVKGE